jgi:hypothetical protein
MKRLKGKIQEKARYKQQSETESAKKKGLE